MKHSTIRVHRLKYLEQQEEIHSKSFHQVQYNFGHSWFLRFHLLLVQSFFSIIFYPILNYAKHYTIMLLLSFFFSHSLSKSSIIHYTSMLTVLAEEKTHSQYPYMYVWCGGLLIMGFMVQSPYSSVGHQSNVTFSSFIIINYLEHKDNDSSYIIYHWSSSQFMC